MPEPSGDKDLLAGLIQSWKELRAAIRRNDDNPLAVNELRDKRRDLVDQIQGIAQKSPRLAEYAVSLGFREDLLEGRADAGSEGVPSGVNAGESKVPGAKGSGSVGGLNPDGNDPKKPPGDKKPPGGPGGGGDSNNRWLPGVKGKDFQVVRYGDKTYVVYKIKVGGKTVPVSWRVPKDKLDTYGIGNNEGREITKAQMKKLNHFGNAEDIRQHGEDKHPFRQWLERTNDIYGGTGLLKNKQAMAVLLEAYVEGHDQEWTLGALKQTKWWEKSTTRSREWAFDLTPQEKKLALGSTEQKIKDHLRTVYGDDWQKYANDKQISQWALGIQTGKWGLEGDPSDAFTNWASRLTRKAEKVMGTPAQVSADEQRQENVNSSANPEVMFAQLRAQAQEWLGYSATPDRSTVMKWASQLAGGQKSQTDWEGWLRQQKAALHPYLDPNETWQDRASTYKSVAERLLGTTIGFDDRLLRNLQGTKPDGSPGERAMSLEDFEQQIRKTNRFWESETAKVEGQGLVQLLEASFLGKAS